MSRATPNLKHLAERLLGYEAVAGTVAPGAATAAARVSEKLRQVLTRLLGAGGFRALLARAVVLAKAEAPELGAVQVETDGSLEGLKSEAGPSAKGEIVLIAQFLGLLVTFVGEALMLSLVQNAWPKVELDH
jgi:hypothetical protein